MVAKPEVSNKNEFAEKCFCGVWVKRKGWFRPAMNFSLSFFFFLFFLFHNKEDFLYYLIILPREKVVVYECFNAILVQDIFEILKYWRFAANWTLQFPFQKMEEFDVISVSFQELLHPELRIWAHFSFLCQYTLYNFILGNGYLWEWLNYSLGLQICFLGFCLVCFFLFAFILMFKIYMHI